MMQQRPIPVIAIEELEANPHEVFRQHRPRVPFVSRGDGVPVILRAQDVRRLLNDPHTRQAETEFARLRGIADGPLFDLFLHGMLTSNGAAHRQRRAPFSPAFSHRMISGLRPRIRRIAEDLIDAWHFAGRVELVEGFASILPARLMAEMLGLPAGDIPYFSRLVHSVSRVASFSFEPADVPEMESAARQLLEYAASLLEERRAAPRDDFLTSYLNATEGAGTLSSIETLVQIAILIIGGSDTTRAALATQLSLLLEHPSQWEAVCRDPTLIPAAVSEALRFEPSVASVPRFTLKEIELDGHTIPANQFMVLSTLSALRDESVFSAPDSFDIFRPDQQRWHLAFGGGPHRCLGEALARMELEEGLAALAGRLHGLQLSGSGVRLRGHAGIRVIDSLDLTWRC